MIISQKNLDNFHKAALSLKLFSRAELNDEKNRNLIEKLYVDPLPNEQVFRTLLSSNTTFVIGRKGTGKSTIFQRVQHEIRKNKHGAISAYMDIRNVYETSQVEPASLEKVGSLQGAMTATEIGKFLLLKRFFKTLLKDIRDELKNQVERNFLSRLKDNLIGSSEEAFEKLDAVINRLDNPDYEDIAGYIVSKRRNVSESGHEMSAEGAVSGKLNTTTAELNASLKGSKKLSDGNSVEEEFSKLFMRIIQVNDVIGELRSLLKSINMKHLYVFLDDFSELPSDAMTVVVDTLISPLSRWSDFIKFKIAAYPGRIYLGSLDKTKIEEINLDIYSLYGGTGVGQMEHKATDFVKRLITKRLEYNKIKLPEVFANSTLEEMWRTLFFASMANPRTLGHILLYSYESNLIYHKQISTAAIQDASERFFDEKVFPFFETGKYRLAFQERSSIYSLKELFEKIVRRAKTLRQTDSRSLDRNIADTFTSHFYVSRDYDDLLQSLELSFFLTKYFEQSNREGQRVSVFALNYGLCNKYQIGFGRPTETRADRLHFVSRRFDYNGILREYINLNQEIRCNSCNRDFDQRILPALKLMGMNCPTCQEGKCVVINLSKKYESIINSVEPELLLPDAELGILQTLKTEDRNMVAAEIASELDCSGQMIGRRGKNLYERRLVERMASGQVYSYYLTDEAKSAYFDDAEGCKLDLDVY